MRRPDLYSPEYRAARKALRALGRPCWLCGKPIRYDLKGPHPLSFTADHVVEPGRCDPAMVNDPSNLRPAHYGCNSRRGAHYGNGRGVHGPRPERAW